jgi:starvation-inducible DNA-binding protein
MRDDQKISTALNGLLADATVFYQKLRHYHWNVAGQDFFTLHTKFEQLYTAWADSIDLVAERILMIDGVPLHTLRSILETTRLQEDETVPPPADMVDNLVTDMRTLRARVDDAIEAAEAAGDRSTANLLDDLRDGIEKEIWMLAAWKKQPAGSWS